MNVKGEVAKIIKEYHEDFCDHEVEDIMEVFRDYIQNSESKKTYYKIMNSEIDIE